MKEKLYNKLLKNLESCEKCCKLQSKNGKDYSLINIYKDNQFCKNVPSIWTDWFNRLNSKIMIIGQDWGPYCDMELLNKLYLKESRRDY